MPLHRTLLRLALSGLLIGSLGACAVVPLPAPGYYGRPPVVIESYPTYRYQQPYRYDDHDRRPHGHRGYDYYR